MQRTFLGNALIGALAVVLLSVGLGTASAAEETAITIGPGTLAGGRLSFAGLPAVLLDGTRAEANATWQIDPIIDARGTGAGWSLRLTLAPLREYDALTEAYVTDGRSLPDGSLIVAASPAVTLVDASSSPVETVAAVAVGTALDTSSPVTLLGAAPQGGMGSYAFGDLVVKLTVPANAYADTYATDALVSLDAGP